MAEGGESRVSDKPGLLDETLLKIVIIIICSINNNNYLVVMHICLYPWHLGDRSRKIKSYTVSMRMTWALDFVSSKQTTKTKALSQF